MNEATRLYHRIRAMVLRDINAALAGRNTAGGATATVIDGHSHDDRYYSESESDSRFVNVAGDNLTGNLTANAGVTVDGVDISAWKALVDVSIETDGTLKSGAVDVAAVLADSVVTAAKIADGAVASPNLALDPFNERYAPVTKFILQDGRRRWYAATTSSTLQAVASAPSGVVTRIPSTESQGRKMWLDEMGLVAAQSSPVYSGDVVSAGVWALVPSGLTIKLYVTFRDADNLSTGTTTSSNVVGDGTLRHISVNALTIPADTVNLDVYIVTVSGSGNTDIYAWGLYKGNQAPASIITYGVAPRKRESMNLAYDSQNQLLTVRESPDERLRWYNYAVLERVAGSAGVGLGTPIIRIAGTTGGGRRFWLDEMGLKVGDKISIGVLAKVGTGRTFRIGYAWRAAPGTSVLSSGSYPSSDLTGEDTTAVYAVENLTIPASAEMIDIFPSALGGTTANFDIYAWYIVKGPTLGDNTPAAGGTDGTMALNVAGKFPAVQLSYGRGYLRDWFAKLQDIVVPDGTTQAVVACIGDSWMHLDARLVAPLRDKLQAEYGNGGPGWISANSDVYLLTESNVVARTRAGTWTNRDKSSTPRGYGPDLNDAYTTDTATPAKITFTATSTPITAVDIHYLKVTNGLGLEYQVDGGGWSSAVDTNASEAHGVVSITGLSDANGHAIEVRAAAAVTGSGAGGLTILGIDAKRTGVNGVRVVKLGSNGSRASHWNSHPNSAVWQAALTQMGVNLALITLGTNEHGSNIVPSVFASDLNTMIATIRASSSLYLDVCLLFPSDNGGSYSYAVHQYMAALRATAVRNNCAALNSYLLLGDYATANTRGLYGDVAHINIDGGRVIIRTLFDELLRLP